MARLLAGATLSLALGCSAQTAGADAAGADAVVFAGDSVDPHNGKSVRASAGSFFHLPIVRERIGEDDAELRLGVDARS
mgnify:CR=1 FL=1